MIKMQTNSTYTDPYRLILEPKFQYMTNCIKIQEQPSRFALEWMDLDPSLYRDRGYITQKAINTIITPSNVVEQNKKMWNFNQINLYNVSTLWPLFYWRVIKLIMAGVVSARAQLQC